MPDRSKSALYDADDMLQWDTGRESASQRMANARPVEDLTVLETATSSLMKNGVKILHANLMNDDGPQDFSLLILVTGRDRLGCSPHTIMMRSIT